MRVMVVRRMRRGRGRAVMIGGRSVVRVEGWQ